MIYLNIWIKCNNSLLYKMVQLTAIIVIESIQRHKYRWHVTTEREGKRGKKRETKEKRLKESEKGKGRKVGEERVRRRGREGEGKG